jgi:HD-like signal output (HDOD) protein
MIANESEATAIASSTGIALSIALAAAAGVAITYRLLRKPGAPAQEPSAPAAERDAAAVGNDAASSDSAYSTDATEAVAADCYKLAFGVGRFDYNIIGEHAAVLERVNATAAQSVHQREYFPRRPMLLPKLLQALNDSASTRQELVKLILEDPALAGSVLQRANNAYYRLSPEPVDSLDRAVVMLGTEGLRGLMATAILQPVFRLPKGYFDNFAAITWEQAQRSAVAAETYAKSTRSADPFVAQLLGLLRALARIVLFRLTMEMYREQPNILPRAEVFIRSMQAQGPRVAGLIAATWQLSDPSIAALAEQANQRAPATMSALGRAVYFGDLSGALAMLEPRGAYSADGVQAMLLEQGLERDTANALRQAALSVGTEA